MSETAFRNSEQIVCVDDSGVDGLILGMTYTVEDTVANNESDVRNPNEPLVNILNSNHRVGVYRQSRFISGGGGTMRLWRFTYESNPAPGLGTYSGMVVVASPLTSVATMLARISAAKKVTDECGRIVEPEDVVLSDHSSTPVPPSNHSIIIAID